MRRDDRTARHVGGLAALTGLGLLILLCAAAMVGIVADVREDVTL